MLYRSICFIFMMIITVVLLLGCQTESIMETPQPVDDRNIPAAPSVSFVPLSSVTHLENTYDGTNLNIQVYATYGGVDYVSNVQIYRPGTYSEGSGGHRSGQYVIQWTPVGTDNIRAVFYPRAGGSITIRSRVSGRSFGLVETETPPDNPPVQPPSTPVTQPSTPPVQQPSPPSTPPVSNNNQGGGQTQTPYFRPTPAARAVQIVEVRHTKNNDIMVVWEGATNFEFRNFEVGCTNGYGRITTYTPPPDDNLYYKSIWNPPFTRHTEYTITVTDRVTNSSDSITFMFGDHIHDNDEGGKIDTTDGQKRHSHEGIDYSHSHTLHQSTLDGNGNPIE